MNRNRAEYLTHDGVMTSEISDLLICAPKGIFVDATYGFGSHFKYFSENHSHLSFIGFDRDEEAVNNSSKALYYFGLGLPAFVLIKIFSTFFFANHDTKTPFYISLISVILNVCISVYYFKSIGFISKR